MYVDYNTRVSAAQQVTVDALSTNAIDLGDVTPKRQIGNGEPMGFAVSITAIGTTTGSADIQVIGSAAANLSSAVVYGLVRLATADLAAGKTYFVPVPPGTPALRYIGLNYDITGTVDFTVTAFLTSQALFAKEAPVSYADAITVS